MTDIHNHLGLMKGKHPRNHLMAQKHKDDFTIMKHNEDIKNINNKNYNKYLQESKFNNKKIEIAIYTETAAQKPVENKKLTDELDKISTETVFFPIVDGFIMVDMTEDFPHDGLRIKFKRTEGEKRRTIGLEIKA